MDTPPIPVSPPPAPGLTPSASTVGSGTGSFLGIVVIGVLEHYGWNIDAMFAGGIVGLCAVAAGYLPSSGRR